MWKSVSRSSGLRGGAPEERVEPAVRHGEAGAIVEVRHVEPERAVGLEVDQVLEDLLLEPRLAVGRKPHHLVLAGVDLEPRVVGEGRVEQPERMREVDLLVHLEPVAPADGRGGRRPLADAVHRQDHGLLERRREERARRMAQVVLAEQKISVPAAADGLEFLPQQVLEEKLFPQPQGNRHAEGAEPPRREGEIGLDQSLELEERLVVEHHMVDVPQGGPPLLEAIADRVPRKPRIVLLAGEALLLGGCDNATVLDQRGRAVVVEGRDPEDAQGVPLRTACR
jgi:hypothetical protein